MKQTLEDRFWSKVDRRGPDECWLWQASLKSGYGQFVPRHGEPVLAHRFAYELLVGPIPEGLTIDHVKARGCISTRCVNPAHLEPVTMRENILRSDSPAARYARRSHCPNGHELSGDNLVVDRRRTGRGGCRTCMNAKQRARRLTDPETVRQGERERGRRYYLKHRDERNAKARAKRKAQP